MTFEYRDDWGRRLNVSPDADHNDQPVVALWSHGEYGVSVPVRVPADRVEEVVAGIRDAARTAAGRPAGPLTHTAAANATAWAIAHEKAATDRAARTASGQQPETTPWITDGRHGPTPEEMAAAVKRRSVATVDPAVCPRCKGDNQEAFELCADCADPTTADDPTPLRWGLGDVLWGDDDTVTICLSGPDREPYWLELEPEQAAALRDDLAGPDGQDDIGSEGPDPCSACPTFPCRKCAPAVGQPAEAQATDEAEFTDASTAFMQIGQTPALRGLRVELRIEGYPPIVGNYAGAGMRRLEEGVLAIEPLLLFAWANTAADNETVEDETR